VRDKLLYISFFLAAFLVTTAAIMYMNGKYNNIFKLDFQPPADSLAKWNKFKKKKMADSLKTLKIINDSTVKAQQDSIKLAVNKRPEVAEINKPIKKDTLNLTTKMFRDTTYIKWKKETLRTFDKMDAEKVAKILLNYSDNIARDVFYSMKKNKAAEVLSQLTPEQASKLTRFK